MTILLFSGLAFGAYTVQIGGVDYDFTYRRTVTIQPLQVQGGPHGDFPMLFDSKTDAGLQADLVSAAGKVESPDGYDIVFAETEEVEIFSHEIEKYDSSTGEYVAWIKIPASFPLDNGTQFYLYYGSTDVTDEIPDKDSQHVNEVWSNGFAAVWHLKENPAGAAPQMKDSTSNPNDATSHNMLANDQVPGQIDGSLDFDGYEDQLTVPDHTSLDITDGITLEAWVYYHGKTSSDQNYAKIVFKEVSYDDPWNVYSLALDNDPANQQEVRFEISTGSPGSQKAVESTSVIPNNTWTHLAATYDGSVMRIYFNGNDQNQTYTTITIGTSDEQLAMGDWTDYGDNLWDGLLDEIRVSSVPRSAGWIETEYNNQKTTDWNFYQVSSEQTLVKLSYFRAKSLDSAVLLEWETETELDNAGFNVWRSEDKDRNYMRINPYFIPARGNAGFGAEYSYTDYDVTNGVIYYYKLEDIDIYGKSTYHGPVSAIPNGIIPVWPDEGEILPSGALLFSWASSGSYSYKVEISTNLSFPVSETLSFPEKGWISGNSLWLTQKEWEQVLMKAQVSGGQIFWRLRARDKEGKEIFSGWKKFIFQDHHFLEK